MAPDSVQYTSFVVPQGQYEYARMPFGLKNAPSDFQRFMNEAFSDIVEGGNVVIYMDDIIIATATWAEHIEEIKRVLERMRNRDLRLKFSKCKFGFGAINYLGYEVNEKGIRPNNDQLVAIERLQPPTNLKTLRSTLGPFSYSRMFVPGHSKIAKPLHQLTKDGVKFQMSPECMEAFDTLKKRLLTSPVLAIFQPGNETEVHCDASGVGFGAVLMQRQLDQKFHPVSYYSRTATPAENRYHSFELEDYLRSQTF